MKKYKVDSRYFVTQGTTRKVQYNRSSNKFKLSGDSNCVQLSRVDCSWTTTKDFLNWNFCSKNLTSLQQKT